MQTKTVNSLLEHFFHLVLIHSGYFYSAFSSSLLRGAPDTARIGHLLCRIFTPNATANCEWRTYVAAIERDSNPRPFGRKAPNLPMRHHAPKYFLHLSTTLLLSVFDVFNFFNKNAFWRFLFLGSTLSLHLWLSRLVNADKLKQEKI